jgi:hypothetical protein
MRRSVRVGASFVSFNHLIGGHSPSRALPLLRFLRGMTATPRELCCDGYGLAPLETEVQPMQASPCVQDLRNGMYIPSMTSALRPCSCPLWVSPLGQALSLRSFALNLTPFQGESHKRRSGAHHRPTPLLHDCGERSSKSVHARVLDGSASYTSEWSVYSRESPT